MGKIVTLENFKKGWEFAEEEKGWCLRGHIKTYKTFKNKDFKNESGENKYLKKTLILWSASRNGRINWGRLYRERNKNLRKLPKKTLSDDLTENDFEKITNVVKKITKCKLLTNPSFVFGSKATHFYFPCLVPAIDSNVRGILVKKYRNYSEVEIYKNYLRLGNEELKDNQQEVEKIYEHINKIPDCNIDRTDLNIDAKIFEWCLLGE